MNNQEILDELNSYVVGHEEAKKTLIAMLTRSRLRHYQKHIKRVDEEFLLSPMKILLIGASGSGKEQPLSALVSTPMGWVRMGDIKVGDVVHGYNGTTKVTGVYPQGLKDVYKIKFTDGRSCEAGLEHLWEVSSKKQKQKGKSRVMSTKDILAYGIDRGLFIKVCKPIEYSPIDCVIPPYSLGVLLGDGCLTMAGINISSSEEDIIARVASELQTNYTKNPANYTYKWSTTNQKQYKKYLDSVGLSTVSGSKFIPKEYLFGSVAQRQDLLKGLMDTDGCVGAKNRFSFSTTSEALKNDFIYLCRSLGYIASATEDKRRKYKSGVCYSVSVQTNDVIFSSKKHTTRYKSNLKGGHRFEHKTHIKIASISLDRQEASQCIMLESSDHLYITNDFVVTHNTHLLESLQKIVHFPLVRIDATELAPSGAGGGVKPQDLRKRIVDTAQLACELFPMSYFSLEGAVDKTVVFVDEIDKLGTPFESSGNWNKHVQSSFLTLFDNKVEFAGLSFIFAGAFTEITKNKKTKRSIGFNSSDSQETDALLDDEIVKNGLIPEIVGRLTGIVELDKFDKTTYLYILKEKILPKKRIDLAAYGVFDLDISEEMLEDIADRAAKSNQGVRYLHRALDRHFLSIEFDAGISYTTYNSEY